MISDEKSDEVIKAISKMADNLLFRVNKTELDFVEHLKTVEERLDQLVELTKVMAVVQNEISHQDDKISDIKKTISEISGINSNRLDQMANRMLEQDKEHRDLKDKFNRSFWVVMGGWAICVFWFNSFDPVDKISTIVKDVKTLKDDVKEIQMRNK